MARLAFLTSCAFFNASICAGVLILFFFSTSFVISTWVFSAGGSSLTTSSCLTSTGCLSLIIVGFGLVKGVLEFSNSWINQFRN